MSTAHRLLEHNAWATRRLLERCRPLTPQQFQQRFEIGPGSLHDTLRHIVGAMFRWSDRIVGRPVRESIERTPQPRTPDELLALLAQAHRAQALNMLRRLGVADLPELDAVEWEIGDRVAAGTASEARMEAPMEAPQFPVGPFDPPTAHDAARCAAGIAEIEAVPGRLRALLDGLAESDLETPYRRWTIRQIVHHLADSHLNAYVRFKLALTEERPAIKPYDESLWSELADARRADVETSLRILEGLHARWTALLRSLDAAAFGRAFFHPEGNEFVPLWRVLALYAWHGRHHAGQIEWLRNQMRGRARPGAG